MSFHTASTHRRHALTYACRPKAVGQVRTGAADDGGVTVGTHREATGKAIDARSTAKNVRTFHLDGLCASSSTQGSIGSLTTITDWSGPCAADRCSAFFGIFTAPTDASADSDQPPIVKEKF